MESSNKGTVLVVGSTGLLGSEICRQLAELNWNVKGLVRSSSNKAAVEALHQMGIETLMADIKDRDSLDAIMSGIDMLITTVSSTSSRQPGDSIETVDIQGQMNVVDAASKAGVRQIVYISVVEFADDFPLQTAKRKVEQHIKQSGIAYTILRPAMFMDVWLSPHLGFDYLHSRATVYGEGKNPISWIAVTDVAAFAVASLNNPAAVNKILTLGGPEALSPLEVIKEFEQQTRTLFSIDYMPVTKLMAKRDAATDSLEKSFPSLMLGYARGCVVQMDSVLQDFPMKLTSVSDYAKRLTPVKSAVL